MKSKIIFYSTEDYKLIEKFRLQKRISSVNQRFDDKISIDSLLFVLKKYELKCFYCDDKLDAKFWQLDHFHARARGGKNISTNIVPTCRWCNTMKRELDGFAFLTKCKKISENNFLSKHDIKLHDPNEKEKKNQLRVITKPIKKVKTNLI